MMWLAGLLAALSSINYPSLNALLSKLSNRDQQGKLHMKPRAIFSIWLKAVPDKRGHVRNLALIGER